MSQPVSTVGTVPTREPETPAERELLRGLNDAQTAAVTTTAAPLCILAGAGSGKTRVLTRRIAFRILRDDIDPRHVLALTFTRKAAGELTSRLRALGLREHLAAGTFHAIALAQLRSRWADRGITPPGLLERKVGFVARLLGSTNRTVEPIEVVTEIEWAKARMIEPSDYATAVLAAGRRTSESPDRIAAHFARYEEARRDQRLIDFDDILRVCRRDLLGDPEFAAAQRWRIRHLFVDEFQDVNPLQYALLEAWRGENLDLCVVGDPNQSIYAWNGAEPTLLSNFPESFPGFVEVIRLTENYRSTPQILAVANATLAASGRSTDRAGALHATRTDGPLPTIREFDDDREEARGIARAVRDHHAPGTRWSAQAVLVRTNAQIPVIEEALGAAGVPFRVRGATPLLQQPEVIEALGQLRRARGSFADALGDLALSVDEAEATGDRAAERRANVDALVQLGRDYLALDAAPSMAGFSAWLATTTRADQPDAHGDAVEITTFHGAKGLEWPVVHLAGLETGLVPISRASTRVALDEERRLFYVAITRAEQVLSCSWAAKRRFGSNEAWRTRSPYLDVVSDALDALRAGMDPVAVGGGATLGSDARGSDARGSDARGSDGRGSGTADRRRSRPTITRPRPSTPDLDTAQQALFDALRAWRQELASASKVPAFVIFNDATLHQLVARRPSRPEELLEVSGFGPVKVERFGEPVLAIIAAHERAATDG